MKTVKKLLLVAILPILAFVLVSCTTCTTRTQYIHNLQDLVLTSSTQGRFFLASGSISEGPVYIFTEILDDRGMYTRLIPSTSAIVYNDAVTGKAWVEYKEGRYAPACSKGVEGKPSVINEDGWYEIHIPPGTMTTLDKIYAK